jgi:hypothetical protein
MLSNTKLEVRDEIARLTLKIKQLETMKEELLAPLKVQALEELGPKEKMILKGKEYSIILQHAQRSSFDSKGAKLLLAPDVIEGLTKQIDFVKCEVI